jgi:quercetin dioxygenase-like cupin family protein
MSTPGLFIQPADDGPVYSIVGDVYRIVASGEQTGGAFALIDALVPPGGGPPPHWHTREDESFFVLEGMVTFTVDGLPNEAGPGTFVHVKKEVRHSFRNNTDRPARMLIHVAPAGLERYFAEVGVRLPDAQSAALPFGEEDVARLVAGAGDYGIYFVPPAE